MKLTVCIAFLIVPLILFGCAATVQHAPRAIPITKQVTPDSGWWAARFRIYWPDEVDEASWYIDTLIADKIVAPILKNHRESIELWRFHRRAARDVTGHRFSFIFYASGTTADAIYAELENAAMLKRLTHDRIVREVLFDDTSEIKRPNVRDTSDSSWPTDIQQFWPHFIMGSSQMWLELIKAHADRQDSNLDLYARYRRTQTEVSQLWTNEAQHAFFHHLSALFSYKPVIVIKQDVLTF